MFSGILISLYCIGFLITVAGILLYNMSDTDVTFADPPVSFGKGLLYSTFWFITWIVVSWEIYKVDRDGS